MADKRTPAKKVQHSLPDSRLRFKNLAVNLQSSTSTMFKNVPALLEMREGHQQADEEEHATITSGVKSY